MFLRVGGKEQLVREPDYTGSVTADVQAPPDELVVLIIRAAKALVDRLRSAQPEDAHSPMTVVHGLAARYLLGRDDVTAGDLARYLRITKQSTSEVVALLEQAGIVRRAPHARDGRARVLLLTDDGVAKLEQGRLRWQRVEDEWAELVGRGDLDTMRDALLAFLRADDAVSSPTGPAAA